MGKLNFKGAGKRILNRAGGGFTGGAISYGIDKLGSGWNPWLRMGLKAGIGALAPELAQKNEFMQHAGSGMVACAVQDLGHHVLDGGTTSGVGNAAGDEKEYVVDVDADMSGTQNDAANSAMGNDDASESAMGAANSEDEEQEED